MFIDEQLFKKYLKIQRIEIICLAISNAALISVLLYLLIHK